MSLTWLDVLFLIAVVYFFVAIYFVVWKKGSSPRLFSDIKFLFYATVMFSAFVIIHDVVRKEQANQDKLIQRLNTKEVLTMEGWLRSIQDTPELFPPDLLLLPPSSSLFVCRGPRDCTKMAALANQFFLAVDRFLTEVDHTNSQIPPSVAQMWALFMSPPAMQQFWYKARPWYPARTQQVLDRLAVSFRN